MVYEIGKEYLHMGNFVKLVHIDGDEATIKSRFEEHSLIRLSELREKEPRVGEVRKRLFVCSPGLDDTFCHMADSPEEAKVAVSNMLEAEFHKMFEDGEGIEVQFEIREMTDAEVAALPDL